MANTRSATATTPPASSTSSTAPTSSPPNSDPFTFENNESPTPPSPWKKRLTRGLRIIGGAFLTLVGLAALGVGALTLPLGIGVLPLGAGLAITGAGVAMLSNGVFDAMELTSPKKSLMLGSALFLGLGIALMCTGILLPLGLASFIAGAVMLGGSLQYFQKPYPGPGGYSPVSQSDSTGVERDTGSQSPLDRLSAQSAPAPAGPDTKVRAYINQFDALSASASPSAVAAKSSGR